MVLFTGHALGPLGLAMAKGLHAGRHGPQPLRDGEAVELKWNLPKRNARWEFVVSPRTGGNSEKLTVFY